MNKPRTQKQIEASRRNGQNSNGPNTETGRAVSGRNAIKHGIFSREVIVPGLHHEESSEEFEILHQRFREDLNPVGSVEEMLVDLILTTHWRMRRAMRAESGEIALSVEQAREQSTFNEKAESPALKWSHAPDRMSVMERTAIGTASIELFLGEARASVEQAGELTEAAFNKLVKSLGGPNRFTQELEKFRSNLAQSLTGLEATVASEKQKNETLAWFDGKLTRFRRQLDSLQAKEERLNDARKDAAVLPDMPVLEKILLYEMRLDRRMHRALTQLERLQRMRRGEAVPPPLKLELAEDS